MPSSRTKTLLILLFFACAAPFASWAAAKVWRQVAVVMPAASAVVKPHAYVSLDRVPRGQEFQIAVVMHIASGFHMNSHKPSEAYLIPTSLTPQLPAGIDLDGTIYPPGHLEKFSFSPKEALDVYSGSVTLRLRLLARATAALGTATIPMKLRYQACNDSACLPPVTIPVNVKVEIAPAGAKARAVHREIFAASGSSKET